MINTKFTTVLTCYTTTLLSRDSDNYLKYLMDYLCFLLGPYFLFGQRPRLAMLPALLCGMS